jgi:hypothetical protein
VGLIALAHALIELLLGKAPDLILQDALLVGVLEVHQMAFRRLW